MNNYTITGTRTGEILFRQEPDELKSATYGWNLNDVISYMQSELADAKREMFKARASGVERNIIVAEAVYSHLFMVCNDMGIA